MEQSSCRHPRAERGQVIVLTAILLAVMVGIAGLAVDGARDRAALVNVQFAADTASLAVAAAWDAEEPNGSSVEENYAPNGPGGYPSGDSQADNAVNQAPLLAALNGITTSTSLYHVVAADPLDVIFYTTGGSGPADSGIPSGWSDWVEVIMPDKTGPCYNANQNPAGGGASASAGNNVNSPNQGFDSGDGLGGPGTGGTGSASVPQNACIEVRVRQAETNLLGGIIRDPTTVVTATSVADTERLYPVS